MADACIQVRREHIVVAHRLAGSHGNGTALCQFSIASKIKSVNRFLKPCDIIFLYLIRKSEGLPDRK